MQVEITKPLELLDAEGHITTEGWARQPYWRYDRAAIKAPRWRIKEWDYYSVLSSRQKFGITLTMSDLGYLGLFAICFLDFERGIYHQIETITLFPLGKHGFPTQSETGLLHFEDKRLRLEFHYEQGRRVLRFAAPGLKNAEGDRGISGSITLAQPAEMHSMNIATSWAENRRAFYYNRKMNCLPATGDFTIGQRKYVLSPDEDFGALDWGRGNWTFKNRWYWGSASARVGSRVLGWNIGYGFSDRTPATENMLIVDGVAHKLADVTFHFDERNYKKPCRFSSSDGRFEMQFTPVVDREATINLGLARSIQHQVFGYFTGTVGLDDGTSVAVDRMLGFAEDVINWW
ncbi:MAG TPA: DUF2804 domain-containing protein [Polyangium sp.]|nr:DUF2804 domain-containing protein [Polyangium sp.]